MHRLLLLAVTILCSQLSMAQCLYDLNGDGVVNYNSDLLIQLGTYGSNDAAGDYNQNGISDVRDLMELSLHLSSPCPVEAVPQSNGRIQDVFLVEYHVHDEALEDSFGEVIEAGSVTYRLYAQLTDATDYVLGVFGDAQAPLSVSLSAPLYQNDGGAVLASDVQTVFYPVFPGLAYDSWLSVSVDPLGLPSFDHNLTPSVMQTFEEEVDDNLGWTWDSEAGAAWLTYGFYDEPELEGDLRLLGQFTLSPAESIEGVVNLKIVTMEAPGESNIVSCEEAFGLSFSSDNALAGGCTDPGASNYNPGAVVDNETCEYLGDLNGDGAVDTDDLLDLISGLGCSDCPDLDLSADGVVNVQDLLVFLTAYSG